MTGRTILILSAALAASVWSIPHAAAQYPDRPLTLIVPWGAGGGTDATARIIGSGLERELGQSISVVNRTGGSGVVGHSAIAEADPDGYTIGIATVEIGMMHWQGLTELTHQDYTPLALMNEDAAGVQVLANSEYETLESLLEAIDSSPAGTFRASGTGQGGIWHLAIAGLLNDRGIDPTKVPWVPSEGAAPGLQDLMAGGVSIVPCSLVEARGLIEAGRVKSLGLMGPERAELFPDVPTVSEAVGSDWQIGAWRGIVGPEGLPDDVAERLIVALEAVYNSDDYKNFMAAQGYGVRWARGEEFGTFMEQADASLGQTMEAVGLAR
ncbi:tripartite tricarboxylate transporter substrate binding protein [Aliihoeflea aestuarii]|jgi:tripartite-type tricarboxylate transporter receptor subunit TctC|uniref:Bug family tripartite tricarboxylate transporter substrate binding protein n=1 Tax=Aliihoeflea aestuarii TaxID=453840 RepID=UPI0020938623|nr:tripartite tricarboxylate transporter substrate binding protein [Aliihoeflea aestuarii]MCO6390802.1 tripartite tricarboxylate transporter substrate binding protein [Aliihoeflea aestuarii]